MIVFVVGTLGFVFFSREGRLIPRGLLHGSPPVLFPIGLPRRLVRLFCDELCSFLSVFCQVLSFHPPGTLRVEVLLDPRCLKTEDKALIFVPICRLRSHSTVMVDTVCRLKD